MTDRNLLGFIDERVEELTQSGEILELAEALFGHHRLNSFYCEVDGLSGEIGNKTPVDFDACYDEEHLHKAWQKVIEEAEIS